MKNTLSEKAGMSASFLFYIIGIIASLLIVTNEAAALIGVEEGDAPQRIVLNDIDGKPLNVSNSFGVKPVIIIFWELTLDKSFLNYSLDELRFLNEYYEKYHKSKGLEIFSIYTPVDDNEVTQEELSAVRNIMTVNKLKFPVLIDEGFKVFRKYGVIALPSTVMVDKSGAISFIYPSFPMAAKHLFVERIEELAGVVDGKRTKKVTETIDDSAPGSGRLYNYSLQMFKKGMYEQALSPLKKAVSLDPDSSRARNLLGIILWKLGNFDAALGEFENAISADAKNAAAHLNYGLLLLENENFQMAEKHLETSADIKGSVAETHYALGLLYTKTGRKNEAITEFEKARSSFEKRGGKIMFYDPVVFHQISALYMMAELYAENGNSAKELEMLRKAAMTALGIDGKIVNDILHKSKDLMVYE